MGRDHSATPFASFKKMGGEMHNFECQLFVMSQEDTSRSQGRMRGGALLIGSPHEELSCFVFFLNEAAVLMWT